MTGKEAPESVHFSITLPVQVVDTLDRMAAAKGSSRSTVVRELVLAGIEREALVRKIVEAVA